MSTKKIVIILELFISYLMTCMFPLCCFRQRIYVAQGDMSGITSETQTHK